MVREFGRSLILQVTLTLLIMRWMKPTVQVAHETGKVNKCSVCHNRRHARAVTTVLQ